LQAHGLHQALDAFAVDRKAHQGADDDDHAPRAVKRMTGVKVDPGFKTKI
jgi:hypothetical protein